MGENVTFLRAPLDIFPWFRRGGKLVMLRKGHVLPGSLCNKTTAAPTIATSPCSGFVLWPFGDAHVWGPPWKETTTLFDSVYTNWKTTKCESTFHGCSLLPDKANVSGHAEPGGRPLPEVL